MKIASRRGHLVALESVAMTDIVLNMFIFFFISFSLLYTFNADRVQSIKVKLPVAGRAVETKEAASLSITITSTGILYLGKNEVSYEALEAEISRGSKENQEMDITLRSDRKTEFQDVVRVLSIISGHRIRNLNIDVIKDKNTIED
ncbi:MAG: biopolymer transporter ExbD [Candidatus Aureabacteria bacterium]|nr:biopolymer transporter ExbD [Candidatus Auribacterota bacterium]